jgi:predicted anti-sigma-YlaC factor YlaD
MNCDSARIAISALLDGEPPLVDRSQLEQHLAECVHCRAWRERAHEVTRAMRLQPAAPAPAPPRELLDTAAAVPSGRWWKSLAGLTRAGLMLTALAQLVVAWPMLLVGSYREAPIHVAHEMGSFELALAIGFLVAAWRPSRATGMRSLVAAAAGLLVATAVIDLLSGRTTLGDEAPHLLAVVGWLLLRELAILTPPTYEDRPIPMLALATARLHRTAPQALHGDGRQRSDDAAAVSSTIERERAAG